MAYNGSGTFNITTAGQPVITGTVISSTAFNALTADLATGLSTAITKDGQTTTTARILFAQGVSSTLVTDATSATTGSIITAGGISMQKALWVGTTATIAGATTMAGITATSLALGGATLGTNALAVTGTSQFNGSVTTTGRITQSLTPAAAEYALRSTGQTTGWIAIDMSNTGGDYIIAGENSAGNNLIVGDSAYDMVIRGPSGISFSANAGATQQMRLSSAGLVGIGMTPSNILDITQNQNAASTIKLLNSNGGTGAYSAFQLSNGTNALTIAQFGTAWTTSGMNRQDGAAVAAAGSGGLSLYTGAAQPIYFGINNAEKARIDASGKFVVGGTNTSYGVISGYGSDGTIFGFDAKTTLNVSTSATTIGTNNDVGFYMVIGASTTPTHRFTDIVLGGYQTATVIGTQNTFGSPAARTYSVTGASFQLAMASGTYDISVFKISMPQIY